MGLIVCRVEKALGMGEWRKTAMRKVAMEEGSKFNRGREGTL